MTVTELEAKRKEIEPYLDKNDHHFRVCPEMDLNWGAFLDTLYDYEVDNDGYTVTLKLKQFPYGEYMLFTFGLSEDDTRYGHPSKVKKDLNYTAVTLIRITRSRGYLSFPIYWWSSIYHLTEKPYIMKGYFLNGFDLIVN